MDPIKHKNFITFEGGEGAGKTTQIKNLADFFISLGKEVIITREPGGTPVAEMLRDIIVKNHKQNISPKTELAIIISARLNHLENLIIPALEQGKIVLSDRYIDSTYVYQGICQGLGIDYINELHSKILEDKFILPNKTFYIDIDVETGLSRSSGGDKGEDRFESKGIQFHQKIRDGFLKISKNDDRIITVNSSQEIEKVKQNILEHAKDLV
ncbi:MAG: dTMP kinase [Alphaproteobacteria bacterium]|nr:dTMP kinase [Alphaproteobacteria bacterium]